MKYILYQYISKYITRIWNVFKEDFCICLSLDAFCIQTQLSNIHVVPLSYHKSNKCSFPFSYFYLSFSLIFLYFSFVHLFQSLVRYFFWIGLWFEQGLYLWFLFSNTKKDFRHFFNVNVSQTVYKLFNYYEASLFISN